jgi:hypothetical protein
MAHYAIHNTNNITVKQMEISMVRDNARSSGTCGQRLEEMQQNACSKKQHGFCTWQNHVFSSPGFLTVINFLGTIPT